MLKMCLNWKVLAGLAAVGVGVYAFAPGLFAAAVPLLLLAVCPLSMVAMMAAMNGGKGQRKAPADPAGNAAAEPAVTVAPVTEQRSVRSRNQRAGLS